MHFPYIEFARDLNAKLNNRNVKKIPMSTIYFYFHIEFIIDIYFWIIINLLKISLMLCFRIVRDPVSNWYFETLSGHCVMLYNDSKGIDSKILLYLKFNSLIKIFLLPCFRIVRDRFCKGSPETHLKHTLKTLNHFLSAIPRRALMLNLARKIWKDTKVSQYIDF